jgi:hypothetical protein
MMWEDNIKSRSYGLLTCEARTSLRIVYNGRDIDVNEGDASAVSYLVRRKVS